MILSNSMKLMLKIITHKFFFSFYNQISPSFGFNVRTCMWINNSYFILHEISLWKSTKFKLNSLIYNRQTRRKMKWATIQKVEKTQK